MPFFFLKEIAVSVTGKPALRDHGSEEKETRVKYREKCGVKGTFLMTTHPHLWRTPGPQHFKGGSQAIFLCMGNISCYAITGHLWTFDKLCSSHKQ